jgi:hypothetical protein
MSGVTACLGLAMHPSLDGAAWRSLLMLVGRIVRTFSETTTLGIKGVHHGRDSVLELGVL